MIDQEHLEYLLAGTIMRMGPGPWVEFLSPLSRDEKAQLDHILQYREEHAAVTGNRRDLMLLSRRRQALRQIRELEWEKMKGRTTGC
ncbi:unnamed protein product [marine sediment metagenome]|uniref:Uncharacterized protein n=1 Tax=marine sediment metagenome TaxID=412755 RepID=X1L0D8_9ZZZZ